MSAHLEGVHLIHSEQQLLGDLLDLLGLLLLGHLQPQSSLTYDQQKHLGFRVYCEENKTQKQYRKQKEKNHLDESVEQG